MHSFCFIKFFPKIDATASNKKNHAARSAHIGSAKRRTRPHRGPESIRGKSDALRPRGRGVFEERKTEAGAKARETRGGEDRTVRQTRGLRQRRFTYGVLHTARGENRRRALVGRLVSDLVQPIVQLGRSGEANGEHEGHAKQRGHGGTRAGILAHAPEAHRQECAATPSAAQLTSEDPSFSRTPKPAA